MQTVNHMRDDTPRHDLLRSRMTRFSTKSIDLESLLRHKHALQRCFTDDVFKKNVGIKDKKKKVEEKCNLVVNDSWNKMNDIC